jgi:enamine deaminase RidA (YjgF/YER057c/UK114 family)
MQATDIVIPPGWEMQYERWHYAPAVRDRDRLWCSGVMGIEADGTLNADPGAQITRAFELIGVLLHTAGLGLPDIVEMTSYHVGLQAHLRTFRQVRDRFLKAPYPAWTAIGVSELARAGGLVEIVVVARLR